jgi:D-alanyl-D-alanine carboxypeptidase
MNAISDMLLRRLGISDAALEAQGLVRHAEAGALEVVQVDADGRMHHLVPTAAAAWRRMKEAAAHDRIDIVIVSAFRSIARQEEIVRRKLDAGLEPSDILTVCAPPGFSEHHTGRAVDIATPGGPLLETAFEHTAAFAWLDRNARRFGFHLSYPAGNSSGYQYEPWHWCHDGAVCGGQGPAPVTV